MPNDARFLLRKPIVFLVILVSYCLILIITIDIHIQTALQGARSVTPFSNATVRQVSARTIIHQAHHAPDAPNILTSPNSSHSLRDLALAGYSFQCDCRSPKPIYFCCQRAMILVHKMGVVAVQGLKTQYFNNSLPKWVSVETPEILSDHAIGKWFEMEYRLPFTSDYRHVVITRNWYDAIISGYLYHKSGKECWLDWYGRPDHNGWLLNNTQEDWEKRLLHHNLTMAHNHPWKPGKGRDLCQYLVDESEDEGLRVYTAWTMASSILPVLEFRRQRLAMEQQKGWNRTIFVCYEQLVSPEKHFIVVNDVLSWLFPTPMVELNVTKLERVYQGGHASIKDPKLRKRLHKIVARLDTELYHGAILQGSSEFGCTEQWQHSL